MARVKHFGYVTFDHGIPERPVITDYDIIALAECVDETRKTALWRDTLDKTLNWWLVHV